MSESQSKESVKYQVQTHTYFDSWINVWEEEQDGTMIEQIFDTREEAQAAIDEFIADTVASPDIEDYDPEDYRVVEVEA